MAKTKEPKKCACAEPKHPSNLPLGINEYVGTAICANVVSRKAGEDVLCGGIINYPIGKEEYEGNDPVEEYLFNMAARSLHTPMNATECGLTMLLRIEKALERITNGSVHGSGTKGSDKR